MDSFEYSHEFQELIKNLHKGLEACPNYENYLRAHLGGPGSRLMAYVKQLCPEIEYHCGKLRNKRVLDFGCGTGSTTAALGEYCDRILAFDIDAERVDACKRRIHEHGCEDRVTILWADDFEKVKDSIGKFDLILVNGVIEHIPLSKVGLRRKILRSLFELVEGGGCLFVNDTPNRLYPYDSHSTQLWWIPWTKPGSEWAYRRAVSKGRHLAGQTRERGELALEEAGAWGATYWEIVSYIAEGNPVCLNLHEGHNKHVQYLSPTNTRRAVFELITYYFAVRLFHIPITALTPYITNLVFKKTNTVPDIPD